MGLVAEEIARLERRAQGSHALYEVAIGRRMSTA